MKILFDQGTPAPLRRFLIGHEITLSYEIGWSRLVNGELLAAAEGVFDAWVTTDQNVEYQQNLTGRTLAIAALSTTNWPRIQRHVAMVVARINALSPGAYDFIEIPPDPPIKPAA